MSSACDFFSSYICRCAEKQSKPSDKLTARNVLTKTSCPRGDGADGDVALSLWLEGDVTLGLSHSWGSPLFTVDRCLFWHRCCPSQHEYALGASRGNRNFLHTSKDNENTYSKWQFYIICSVLTFGIYCWLSALHLLSWRSTSSMNLILWHLACTDDIRLTDSRAQAVFSDLITCRTRAADLITKPFETTPRLLMGNVWVLEDK